MKVTNNNYGITLGISALLLAGFILKFLWFVLAFILVWGFAKILAEYVPFLKKLGKIFKLDKIDAYFNSILSYLYDYLPNILYYAFLLRVPIISGLILFSLPLIAEFTPAAQFLQNIFVMETGTQLILVLVCSTMTAITIVSLLKTILVLIDDKFNENKYFRFGRTVGTILLFSPTWLLLILNKEINIAWSHVFLGISISALVFVIIAIYEYRRDLGKLAISMNISLPIMPIIGIQELKARRVSFFAFKILLGLIFYSLVIFFNWPKENPLLPDNIQTPTLIYALLIIWILTLFIGLVTFLFDSSIDKQLDEDTKKTSNLYKHTFYWPAILFLIIFSASGYGTAHVDHFFRLLDSQIDSHEVISDYEQDFQKAIWNRLCKHKFDINKTQTCNNNKDQSLVVVGASGGGIQASGWMAQVLAGLQDKQLGIGEDFTKAIALISSTSGGSVGSMFYLDQFENGILSPNALQKDQDKTGLAKVVENATEDWLNAVGWGLAFPDLLRAMGLPCVLNLFSQDAKYIDRGYALEKTWEKTLSQDVPTLDSRRQQILEGKIPISVYNTTLVENGRAFLVSPMKFVPGKMADYINESSRRNLGTALDFKTLYHNCGVNHNQTCDLALTTAARLSASFPYVTPMSRNYPDNYIKDEKGQTLKVKDENGKETDFLQNYHIADGGFYDNAGAFTALQWLNNFLKYNDDSDKNSAHHINIKKVLVLQINAFPEDDLQLDQSGSDGFEVVTIGPINTLAGVRDSTQIVRNQIFTQLLHDLIQDEDKIEIRDFAISFPKYKVTPENGQKIPYNPPLSWRLTKNQKMNLEEAWENDSTIRETVKQMKQFWFKFKPKNLDSV